MRSIVVYQPHWSIYHHDIGKGKQAMPLHCLTMIKSHSWMVWDHQSSFEENGQHCQPCWANMVRAISMAMSSDTWPWQWIHGWNKNPPEW